MNWFQKYTFVIDHVSKILWLLLMIHWLMDGAQYGDIFK